MSRAQLLKAGCSPNTIDSWVHRGRLRRVLHGVYDCLALLDDGACAALLDHAAATLTCDRALCRRYLEEVGLRGSPRVAQQLVSLVPGAASAPERLAHGLHSVG